MNVMTSDQPVLKVSSEDEFLADQAQSMRASVYELLSNLLSSAPTEPTLEALRAIGDVDASEGRMAMGWELLKQAACKSRVDELNDEYFELFIGLGRGELVPFGSWYLTGFLMEKPVAALRGDLQQLGIDRQSDVKESEDHIAALCDAMAIIIRNSDEIGLLRQQQFFNDHIKPWVQQFFSDMQNARAAHFYRSVGFFGESFFDFEQQLLQMQS
ncbi:MAG: molecular chaperone TorD family protein [Granulosicoccus sp.]|nr:molecular chaperone TorD family protein [Granulosicoccus sp.]